MSRRARMLLGLAAMCVLAGPLTTAPTPASAALEWRLEQPLPPPPSPGVEGSKTPVGLGRVGDLEFLAPNLGLLITAGNGITAGNQGAVPSGVWAYDGTGWHERSNVCGATDGRIAWAGQEEFWTVSDGRPGQAANSQNELPKLEDNTLCHFGRRPSTPQEPNPPAEVLKSYAALAFSPSEYRAMNAAACGSGSNCWFGGIELPPPQKGAFQLHWNGSSVTAEPNLKATATGDIRVFEGGLYAGIALSKSPPTGQESLEEILHPTVLYEIAPEGSVPEFKPLRPLAKTGEVLPEYPEDSHGGALEYFHLGADENSLWAAAQARATPPSETEKKGQLTVLREAAGVWSQVLGPETPFHESVKTVPPALAEDSVVGVAPEPGTDSAWIAVQPNEASGPTAQAHVVHLSASGELSEEVLPNEQQRKAGLEGKGAAASITCPAQNDCWLATTQGWLFHLSEAGQETLPINPDPIVDGPLITFRPEDEGLPQIPADAPPADTSGEEERPPVFEEIKAKPETFASVPVALLSDMHTRVIHGRTLELRFRLAVKARVRLIAKRHRSVVAETRTETLSRGSHKLTLQLNPRRWPTSLSLQTRALAPLPTVSSRSNSVESVSTSLIDPSPLERELLGSWR